MESEPIKPETAASADQPPAPAKADHGSGEQDAQAGEQAPPPPKLGRKRKYAVWLGYLGVNYHVRGWEGVKLRECMALHGRACSGQWALLLCSVGARAPCALAHCFPDAPLKSPHC